MKKKSEVKQDAENKNESPELADFELDKVTGGNGYTLPENAVPFSVTMNW